MSAKLPIRSLAAYAMQQNCVLFQDIIKHSFVDVASTLEVNHVKSECYVIDSCNYVCSSLSVILYMDFAYSLNVCMLHSVTAYKRLNASWIYPVFRV